MEWDYGIGIRIGALVDFRFTDCGYLQSGLTGDSLESSATKALNTHTSSLQFCRIFL